MKITQIELALLCVPLVTPFKTALRTVNTVEDIVVLVYTDTGNIGYGEAAATAVITGDTHGSIIEAITRYIAPRLINQSVDNLNELIQIIQTSMVGNTSAKAAVEIAIYDLFAQFYNVPLYKILGGGIPKISTDITISVNSIEKMVEDALLAVKQGYQHLKIKIGNNMALDIERIKEIYNAVGDNAILRLDANQGWTAKQAVFALNQLEKYSIPLELLEQPVKAHDIAGLKYITERVNTPVMADESAFSPKQVIEIIQTHAADIINIKLMKTGGISNALKIADIAEIYGVECMMGCMLEAGISVAAAVHIAIAKSHIITKIDLDGPLLCALNPIQGGAEFNAPHIIIPDSPGLGIQSIQGLELIPV